jgi:hypothetical protein
MKNKESGPEKENDAENDAEKDMANTPISEIFEFSHLVGTILDYYETKGEDESESWKKGTSHAPNNIPKEIDEQIKKAFIYQLTKFHK